MALIVSRQVTGCCILIPVILIFFVLVITGGCTSQSDRSVSGTVQLTIVTLGNTTTELLEFLKPKTLADSLEDGHDMKFSGFRNVIKCVDHVCAKGSYYWRVSVNDGLLSQAVTRYWLRDGDHITLEFVD